MEMQTLGLHGSDLVTLIEHLEANHLDNEDLSVHFSYVRKKDPKVRTLS